MVGDPMREEDRVVHLLASLPESYNILVTALEADVDVPKMEVVTERLLHEERKLKDLVGIGTSSEKAMTVKPSPRRKGPGPRCHYCGKFGHIKRNCHELAHAEKKSDSSQKERTKVKQKANKVAVRQRDSSSSDSESPALMVHHVLSSSARPNR